MRSEDIESVMEIEQVAFSAPWSARAYDYELHYNEMAHYYVARPHPPVTVPAPAPEPRSAGQGWTWQRLFRRRQAVAAAPSRTAVVGYGGLWLMLDEAHISTIASHPQWRRQGIGELLLLAMIDGAMEIGAETVTLEVRVSNLPAQTLYRKYGFEIAGQRRGYYSDNGEDAYIMSTPRITAAEFTDKVQGLRTTLFRRLAR